MRSRRSTRNEERSKGPNSKMKKWIKPWLNLEPGFWRSARSMEIFARSLTLSSQKTHKMMIKKNEGFESRKEKWNKWRTGSELLTLICYL